MAPEPENNLRLEIGHVLFIDLVGYSKLLIEEQRERLGQLTEIVLATAQVREAPNEQLIRLPTGDGMALVFRNSSEEPARCALEIAEALRRHPEIPVRMGIHSGPVSEVTDVSGRTNIAGAGINMAQRVMDCGDAGHILLSQRVADDLAQYRQWAPRLHDLGECEVKHGVRLRVVNLYAEDLGNPTLPVKLQHAKAQTVVAAPSPARGTPFLIALVILLASLFCLAIVALIFTPAVIKSFSRQDTAASPKAAVSATAPATPEKSIAVLPFQNLSANPENAFFTDGVQEEILTDLAKIADLKVISRASVMPYKSGEARDLHSIAKSLGVSHVVEGSVQRSGDRVRVTAELIDARSDAQLWAQHFDRQLTDIFAIQSEIARNIAEHLRAKLSRSEESAINRKPTDDIVAYEFFIRAREIVESYLDQEDQRAALLKAIGLIDDATRRDPGFVLAYCYATRAHDLLYFLGLDATPQRTVLAEAAVDTALRLQPDSSEAHFAKADYYFRCHRDYERASVELTIARPGLPNSAPFFVLAGYIGRRRGRWDEATVEFEKAVDLDPRNLNAVNLLGDHYRLLRRFDKAAQWWLAEAKEFPQNARVFHVYAAIAEFAATGQVEKLDEALGALPREINPAAGITSVRVLVALIKRDYDKASSFLEESPLLEFQDVDYTFYYPRAWYEAQIARARGDKKKAHVEFASARQVIEQRPQARAEEPRTLGVLAEIDAALGEKEKAISEAKRAVELMPISKDAYDGPLVLQCLAQVYAWTGKKQLALDAIDMLVGVPGFLDYGYLLRDPAWAPLRGDPRFEKIVASLAPKDEK
jgi:TolB-like protein